MDTTEDTVRIVLEFFPEAQAIYLMGSHGTDYERPDSDVDLGILLPWKEARRCGSLMRTACHAGLERALARPVDLVNVREVSTVFQKEIVCNGRPLYCADENARAEFELRTLSAYQRLNEERSEILQAFQETGRAYDV